MFMLTSDRSDTITMADDTRKSPNTRPADHIRNSSQAGCPEDKVIAQPPRDRASTHGSTVDIQTLKKIIKFCSVLEIIGGLLVALLSGAAILVNSGSGLGDLGVGFLMMSFILTAGGLGLATSLKVDNRCLMLVSAIFIFTSSLAATGFLLASFIFFLFDASLLNFCYDNIQDCPYDLFNLKLRLVVAGLGMIVAVAICCVAIVQFVYITRHLCGRSAVSDQPPPIILLQMKPLDLADGEVFI